jgi:hypothetical protein
MRRRWNSRADELDYIADTLLRVAQEIEATVDQGPDRESQLGRAQRIRHNAGRHREEARRLRGAADLEAASGEQTG